MAQDKLQQQRLELKYIINEEKALAVRDYVRSYLEIDEYGAERPDLSYTIHSLYMDSEGLKTFWDTINGNKNRYKLRVRYYDDRSTSPVFFEVKRRVNDAITKKRGAVRRQAVDSLLGGHFPERDHLFSSNARHLQALQTFSQRMLEIGARPTAHVAYNREAWVTTHDNSLRVTLDRGVRFAMETRARLGTSLHKPVRPFGEKVILEVKFTGRFPNWIRDMVQIFGLSRSSAAKYADGIDMIGEGTFVQQLRREERMAGEGSRFDELDIGFEGLNRLEAMV